jgi:hypothetical protein
MKMRRAVCSINAVEALEILEHRKIQTGVLLDMQEFANRAYPTIN